jgi:hypothetical protein
MQTPKVLTNAKLGERYELFLDVNGISPVYTDILQTATIVASNKDHLMLGWRKENKPLISGFTFTLVNYAGSEQYDENVKLGVTHVSNIGEYYCAAWIPRTHHYWSQLPSQSPSSSSMKKTGDPLFDFFKAAPPGCCQSCGAPTPCSYHP